MRRGRPAKHLTLSKNAVTALESWYRDHPSHRSRQRAQAILLNARGHSAIELATLYGVREETVREWLSRYERSGLEGLLDLPKSGRPTRYSEEQLQTLWPWLREAPRRLREIQTHLTDTTGKTAHPTTLKRYLKKTRMALETLSP